jgi:hypothetical protein
MSMTNQNSGLRDESLVGQSPLSNTKATGKASGGEKNPHTDFGKGTSSDGSNMNDYTPDGGYQHK